MQLTYQFRGDENPLHLNIQHLHNSLQTLLLLLLLRDVITYQLAAASRASLLQPLLLRLATVRGSLGSIGTVFSVLRRVDQRWDAGEVGPFSYNKIFKIFALTWTIFVTVLDVAVQYICLKLAKYSTFSITGMCTPPQRIIMNP
jgi:hypothetical protein